MGGLILGTPGSVAAQPAEVVSRYREIFLRVSRNYREAVRPYVDPQFRPMLNGISFRLDRSQNLFARAYKEADGTRVVEVSFGFLVFMENLTLAYAVAGEARQDMCFFYYLNHTSQVMLRNTQAARAGLPFEPIPFFPAYVAQGGEGCRAITDADIRNPEAIAYVPGGMDALLAFLLGHEVAHHLLGHVDSNDRSLVSSRRMETEADIWAMDHAFAIRINPSPAFPMWAFFAATGGADIQGELESTHPLGLRRWAEALDAIARRMRSPNYAMRFGRAPEDWVIREVERQRDAIRSLVPQSTR